MMAALPASAFTQFNNCGNMAQTNDGIDMASIVSCESTSCVSANPAALKVSANLGNGTYAVPAALANSISAETATRAATANRVHWDLVLNGVIVRNSTQNTGLPCG